MSFRFPSHNKSVNRRRAVREFQKDGARLRQADGGAAVVKKPSDAEQIEKEAAEILKSGLITPGETAIRVWASRTHFYDVEIRGGVFWCCCADHYKQKTCAHIIAARTFDRDNSKETN